MAMVGVMACVLLGSYLSGSEAHREARELTEFPEPTVGIISAFAPELLDIIASSTIYYNTTSAGRQWFLGNFGGKHAVMTVCGIGMVNAAMTTQHLIDKWPSVTTILFSGIAGGLSPEHNVGDVVVVRKWAHHLHQKLIRTLQLPDKSSVDEYYDESVDFPNKFYGVHNGTVVAFTEADDKLCRGQTAAQTLQIDEERATLTKAGAVTSTSFAVPMYTEVLQNTGDWLENPVPQQFWFPVPDRLLTVVETLVKSNSVQLAQRHFDVSQNKTWELDHVPLLKIGQAGVSGSTYVDNGEYREALYSVFGAEITDMESPAIMHVCASNNIDCLVIRSVSDLAGGAAGKSVIQNFIGLAATNSLTVLRAILENLDNSA